MRIEILLIEEIIEESSLTILSKVRLRSEEFFIDVNILLIIKSTQSKMMFFIFKEGNDKKLNLYFYFHNYHSS